jgi:hypothetical protein
MRSGHKFLLKARIILKYLGSNHVVVSASQ